MVRSGQRMGRGARDASQMAAEGADKGIRVLLGQPGGERLGTNSGERVITGVVIMEGATGDGVT
jgi:hypothetical protein